MYLYFSSNRFNESLEHESCDDDHCIGQDWKINYVKISYQKGISHKNAALIYNIFLFMDMKYTFQLILTQY